ncbi:MAG: agmatinase [Clostridiales bacterium]|nr:agmatinase [Clostridiales bacterium]
MIDRIEKNLFALNCPYEEAEAVIFGAPFDGTTSFRPGTRFGPSAMRNESIGLESFSPYQDKDLEDAPICDSGDLDLPFGDAERALDLIEQETARILDDRKLPIMLGGEHLVSLGAFRAVAKKYPDVVVIHFDAHCDLREDYIGSKLSHACVIRRIHDIVGDGRIYQFGIRSGTKEEFEFAKTHTKMERFTAENLDEVLTLLGLSEKPVPVYLTIDLDVLDPSIFPGTGTPEAGGLSFEKLRERLMLFTNVNLVGLDFVELSPPYDASGCSTALALKILRETLIMKYGN